MQGQQYGLSSQGNYSTNKSLIFVKLTDSALRAIGDLFKSGQKSSMCPTIQFQGNQGVISLPRPQATSPDYVQEFSFSLSNVEADGPQGSFECIQQSGARSLHSLGCMLHKMHIHANEESYEKTRVKMASVEKESKMNCTKVIKASGPYVGRKVKLKRPVSTFNPPPKPSCSPPPVLKPVPKPPMNHSSLLNSSGSANNHSSSPHQVSGLNHSARPSATVSPSQQQQQGPLEKPSSTSLRPQGNPDIMRLSYRTRVIHLLALRSYKKPELLARLMKDGIKEKDKKGLSALLSKVAISKGNTFSLARYCWTEVQDDFPFYTQEERDLLKRRRMQMASSQADGSDHLSPSANNSSHSPPFPNSQLQKRPTSQHDYDVKAPNSKKPRISHYSNREPTNPGLMSGPPSGPTISHRLADPGTLAAVTNRKESPTSRNRSEGRKSPPVLASQLKTECIQEGRISPLVSKMESSALSRTSSNSSSSQQRPNSNFSDHNAVSHDHGTISGDRDTISHDDAATSDHSGVCRDYVSSCDQNRARSLERLSSNSNTGHQNSLPAFSYESKKSSLPLVRGNKYQQSVVVPPASKIGRLKATTHAGSTGSRGSSPQSSPESQDSVEFRGSSLNSSPTSTDVPDYVSKYVSITSRDQRAQYKADFNAEYNEYRKLHSFIEQVKLRFEELEYDLRSAAVGSDDWHRIKSQILQEYEENHRGHGYRDTKRRLNYLHDKLSHIKRLVVDYDQSVPVHNTGPRHQQQRHRQQLAMA